MLATLLLLACIPSAGEPDPNQFQSTVAGFEIRKPPSWRFSSSADHLEELKELKLEDAEFQRRLVESSRLPLVIIMKHPEPYEDLNPTVKVQFRPMDSFKEVPPKDIVRGVLSGLGAAFNNLKVTVEPRETEISGLEAGYVEFEYDLETQEGLSFPTTSQIWIVPNGDFMFIIGAGTRTDEASGSREEIRKIVETVKIVPAGSSESAFHNSSMGRRVQGLRAEAQTRKLQN